MNMKSPVADDAFPLGSSLPTDRLMVCISGSPFSERLITTAHRLAVGIDAPWTTMYVETAGGGKHLQENRERVWHDLRLAESLGAQVATVTAESVAEAVIEYATSHGVTKIVVGKPKRPLWREFLQRPLVDRLISLSGPIDVYVVSIEPSGTAPEMAFTKPQPWRGYATSIALVTAVSLFGRMIHEHIAPTNLVMIYLLAVVFAAVRLGLRPAILTAFLSVLAFDFFIIPPHLTLAVSDTEYLITFVALFTVGVVISSLVAKASERAETIRQREVQTSALYHLSRDLAVAVDVGAIIEAVERNIAESMGGEVAVFLRDGERLALEGKKGVALDEKNCAAAEWAFSNQREAGSGTADFSDADHLYLPLQSGDAVVGVLGVNVSLDTGYNQQQIRQLLRAFATQTAMALERVELAQKAEQAQILQARENLERALLNSVSHDLRTPLVSITGALSTLRSQGYSLNGDARRQLIDAAWEEAGRLNRFVGNLLDMSRVEAGEVKLNKEPCDIQDLVGCALAPLDQRLQDREVRIDVPDHLPLVELDMVCMTQVLVNLLENALKYTPPGTPLEISAKAEEHLMMITVQDRGPGVPEHQLERMFEKFSRLSVPERVGGTGLGLSICKGLVEAHGGTIGAENRKGGGLRVRITVPRTTREG